MRHPSATLQEVCTFRHGGTPSKSNPAFWGGDIPWISPKDMKVSVLASAQDSITAQGVQGSATSVVPAGTILLVARSGILAHTLPVALAGRPVAFNQDIKAIQVSSDKVLSEYVYWFLRGKESEVLLRGVKKGATVHSLQSGFLERLAIPLPPIDEQRRIIDLLFRAENIVRMRREAEARAKEIIPALFLDMFGDPRTNPRKYTLASLRDLVDASRPITYGILKPGPDLPDGIPYVRVVDIKDGWILTSQLRRTSTEIELGYKRSRLQGGDLVMSIRGHVGRMAIVPDVISGANITQDSARIAPKAGVEVAFLVGYLEAQATQLEMKRLTKGVAVRGINLGDLKALQVPVPSLNEQKDFTTRFEKTREILSMQSRATEAAAAALGSLMAQLFGEGAR